MHDGIELDESQIARLRDGDERAFEELVARYQRPLLNFLYRIVGSAAEADDVAQDVFLRAGRNIRSFRPDRARLSTWIFQIARNAAIDHLRRRARRAEVPLGPIDRPGPGSDEVVARETGERIARAVAALPEEQRTAFVLSEYHGMSHAEIAAVMDGSEKSVESRIYRAKQALRIALADLL